MTKKKRTPLKHTHSFPDRKISEAILEFAHSMFGAIGTQATTRQIGQALCVASTVWNAVVFDDAAGNRHPIDLLRKRTAHVLDWSTFVNLLIKRKRRLYGDDHRLIGE